jgi:hypothetical protein
MVSTKLIAAIFPFKSQPASALQDEEQALCGLLAKILQEHVSLLMGSRIPRGVRDA